MDEENDEPMGEFLTPTKDLKEIRHVSSAGSSTSSSKRNFKSPRASRQSLTHPRSPSLMQTSKQGILIDRRNYDETSTLQSLSSNAENITKVDLGGIFRKGGLNGANNGDGSDNIAVSLAKALETNTTVVEVNLPGSNIKTDGAIAFATALRANKTLIRLYLNDNAIDNDGARALADALSINTTLIYLGLRRNDVSIEDATLSRINCFLARNSILKDHSDGVAQDGPSFYVSVVSKEETSEDDCDDDDDDATTVLQWTSQAWEAGVGDGKALSLVHHALENLVNAAESAASPSSLNEYQMEQHTSMIGNSYSNASLQSKELFATCSQGDCHKVLEQLVECSTDHEGRTILHVAASLESQEASEFCRFLVEQIGVDIDGTKDSLGRTARDVASSNKTLRPWAKIVKEGNARTPIASKAKAKKLFLGRYNVEDGPPVYQSESYKLQYAHDMNPWKGEKEKYSLVALKIFNDRHAFDREIFSCLSMEEDGKSDLVSGDDIPKDRNLFHENHVVNILRYHDVDSNGETIVDAGNNDQEENIYCVVLPGGWHNLSHVLITGQVPGRDLIEITRVAMDLAMALEHIHEKENGDDPGHSGGGIIHGDVRPQNILFVDGKYKLAGFHSAIKEGELIRNERVESTGVCPPEFAKHLFHPKEEKAQLPHQLKDEILVARRSFDIWSYGALMYHMLTGETLFDYDGKDNLSAESDQTELINWKGLDQTKLHKVLQGYNDVCNAKEIIFNAKDFLNKCLMPNPEDRFGSISDLLSHSFLCEKKEVPPDILLQNSGIEMVHVEKSPKHKIPTSFLIVPHKLQWDETVNKIVLPPSAAEYTQLTLDLQEWSILDLILTALQREEESAYMEMIKGLQLTAATDKVKAAKDFLSYVGLSENAFFGVQEAIQSTNDVFFEDPMRCISEQLTERREKWLETYSSTNSFFYLVDEVNQIPVEDENGIYPIEIETNSRQPEKLLSYMELGSYEMICIVASITGVSSNSFSSFTEKAQKIIQDASVVSNKGNETGTDGALSEKIQDLNDFFKEYDSHHTFAGLCCISDNRGSSLWSTVAMKEFFYKEYQPLEEWREEHSSKKELEHTKSKLDRTQEILQNTEKELESTKNLLKTEVDKNEELQERVSTLETDITKLRKQKAASTNRDTDRGTTQPDPQVNQSACCIVM